MDRDIRKEVNERDFRKFVFRNSERRENLVGAGDKVTSSYVINP